MAENDKKAGGSIPWVNLTALLMAVAGGISAFFQPIISSRPREGSPTVEIPGGQDIDARLWQDPLRVAIDYFEKASAGKKDQEVDKRAQDLTQMRISIPYQKHLLILPVMIPGGPYAEDSERRLRTRQAVISGLAVSGYVPDLDKYIGYVMLPFSVDSKPAPFTSVNVVPYEWLHPRYGDPKLADPKSFEKILILWLRDDLPKVTTIDTLRVLGQALDWDPTHEQISVLGPGTSGSLTDLLKGDHDLCHPDPSKPSPSPCPEVKLQGVELYAAMPTASNAVVTLGRKATDIHATMQLESGPILHRTITPDDEIAQTMIEELGRRNINPADNLKIVKEKKNRASLTNIAVISESDTIYGRALPLTLLAEICNNKPSSVEDLTGLMLNRTGNLDTGVRPEWFHTYSYLRGIDGRLPSDTAPAKSAAPPGKGSSSPAPREATEGEDQSDYLRRLASELAAKDQDLRRKGGKGFEAVGILGSDVYDKLMILRALREELPGALFFTNNLDARLGLPEEWHATHNLVVVSPFGLSLNRKYQRNIPPFRDSYQTSVFASTLLITGVLSPGNEKHPPRIFEIARNGPWDLSLKTGEVDPFRLDTPSWWRYAPRYLEGMCVLLGFGAVFGWIAITSSWIGQREKAHWSTRLSPGALFANTAFASVFAGIVGVVCIWPLYSCQRVAGEPLAFLQGISIWPTEMMRLAVVVLCAHFVWKSGWALRKNSHDIEKEYLSQNETEVRPTAAGESPSSIFAQLRQEIREARKRVKEFFGPKPENSAAQVGAEADSASPNEQRSSAEALWQKYLEHGQWSRRLVRFGPLVFFYLAGSCGLVLMLGLPVVPARGNLSFAVDRTLLIICIACTTALLFYVVDAIRLNRHLIELFDHSITTWPKSARVLSARKRLLNDEELSRYLNILLIAARTEVVCPLVNYPFVVLVLLIVARNSYFDNWDWPLSLIIILTLNLAWAIYSSLQLYRAARDARRTALDRLSGHRLEAIQLAGAQSSDRSIASQTRLKMIDETIDEIAGLSRGAFAPLSEQPFFRAILFASGSIGVGSLIQYLPNVF